MKLSKTFSATHLAIGLDSVGEQANLTVDNIGFSSRPQRLEPVAGAAPCAPHRGLDTWPGGLHRRVGFRERRCRLAVSRARLGLSDWFAAPQITVSGVPFTVPVDPAQVAQTSTAQFDALSLKLPSDVREIYLLTAAAAPATEPWGIDWMHLRPLEVLDVPEKVFFEIRYDTGPPDLVLPLDAATGQWGMRRGLCVTGAHPDPHAHSHRVGAVRPHADRELCHRGGHAVA